MKRVMFLFCVFFTFVVYGFTQNNLTADQIRRYADELGIPYESLKRLVDSNHTPTRLTNPNASRAQFFSIEELDFMIASDILEIGCFYRTRAIFFEREGRSVMFTSPPNENYGYFRVVIDSLVNIPRDTVLDVLIGLRVDSRGYKEYFLVEVALAR